MPKGETIRTIDEVYGMTQLGIEPTTYQCHGGHSNF